MLYSDYEIVFYVKLSGRNPVLDYLNNLPREENVIVNNHINLLLKNSGILFPPYAKHIYKKIWELRPQHQNYRHRIFYFIGANKKIVLLSAFLKKSQKTPHIEIKKAYKYYLNYISHAK